MKGLKILDLRDSPWVDGPGRTILDCAVSLREKEYDVIIASLNGGQDTAGAYAEEAMRRGLMVKTIKERGRFDYQIVRQLTSLIDELNPDVVHTHDFRSNIFGLIAASLRGKPVVSTVHGWIANDIKGKVYVFIDKIALRFFNLIIAVSDRTRRLVEKTGVPKAKIAVISNALRLDQYVIDRSASTFRQELGVKPHTALIACIGRLSPEKGQQEFLMAAHALAREFEHVKFVLIGIGPTKEQLERYVIEKGLSELVVFCGYRSDMINIYNGVDLVVQSSYTEGMPNVVLESLLMEVPVIATDVGGTGEIIEAGKSGVLIKPGSVNALVEQIGNFLRNPSMFRDMATMGRQIVEEKFDHRRRVEKLAGIYREVTRQYN